MKINITKLIQVIGIGMGAVEKFKTAKGKDKEAAVIAAVQEAVPQLETDLQVDFVNNANLNKLLAEYIAARVALANGIAAAKGLKP